MLITSTKSYLLIFDSQFSLQYQWTNPPQTETFIETEDYFEKRDNLKDILQI